MNIPNNLPILKAGNQAPGSGAVCAEQAVNWLVSGRLDLGDETDLPECVQPVLNDLAIHVNDKLGDEDRQEMWPIILRQPGTARPDMEPELSGRLAIWCARQVLPIFEASHPDDDRPRKAIEAAERYWDNPTAAAANVATAAAANVAAANPAANVAYAAHAAAEAAAAATDASAAAYAVASAVSAAYATAAEAAFAAAAEGVSLIDFLAGAQDECERLTGHVPAPVDTARLELLGQLVGTIPNNLPNCVKWEVVKR